VESAVNNKNVSYAAIGIGINVNLDTVDYPEIESIATSLSREKGEYISRLDIIRNLLVEIEKLYLLSMKSDAVYKEWLGNMDTVGKKVHARSGENVYEGVVDSVSRDGSLMLLQPTDGW
jgi:biotin-(acetyl-CoA carboxylase) ligase